MFRKITEKYGKLLYGRYGQDGLNRFISLLAIAICLLSFLVRSMAITVSVLVLLAISLFRSFSKNFKARKKENEMYEKAAKPVKRLAKYWFIRLKSHKTHRVDTCEKCQSILRVPKAAGGGKIAIKCPKCGDSFVRRIGSAAGSAGGADK